MGMLALLLLLQAPWSTDPADVRAMKKMCVLIAGVDNEAL